MSGNIKAFEKLFDKKSKNTFKSLSEYNHIRIYGYNFSSDKQFTKYKPFVEDLKTTKQMKFVPG